DYETLLNHKNPLFFLPIIDNDTENIQIILQKHALYELIFGNPSAEKVNRLNHTLNIQWAIDIKNSIKDI
ncbi:MAG: hypothetical protein ACKOAV_11650, partial [Bacteroidota bacterium]